MKKEDRGRQNQVLRIVGLEIKETTKDTGLKKPEREKKNKKSGIMEAKEVTRLQKNIKCC